MISTISIVLFQPTPPSHSMKTIHLQYKFNFWAFNHSLTQYFRCIGRLCTIMEKNAISLPFFFLHRLSQFRFSNSFKGRFPFKYTIRNGFYSNGFYLKTFDLYLQLWRFYGKIKWNKIEWQKNNQGKINKETQPVH